MAVSGSQKTTIGQTLHGTGIKKTITAKSATEFVSKKYRGFIVNVNKLGLR